MFTKKRVLINFILRSRAKFLIIKCKSEIKTNVLKTGN